MVTVVPRSKKRRTLPDQETQLDPLPMSSTMLAHHQAPPQPPPQPNYPQPGPSSAAGPTSTRSTRPLPGLSTVSEVIGGKVQEVFVLDDDSPPPANPLDSHPLRPDGLENYTYANANGHPAYGHPGYGDPRYNGAANHADDGTAAAAKGKRKAQGSVPPTAPDTHLQQHHHLAAMPHDADLIAPAPGTLQGPPAGSSVAGPTTKRRKRSHPVQPGIAPVAGTAANGAYPAAVATMPGAATAYNAGAMAPAVDPNYRGGYPASSGALDYAARYDPASNAAAAAAAGQQLGYDGTASARESYASSASFANAQAANLPVDDKEGHFIVREGENVTSRYKILGQLGQGTFGKVVECFDRKERKYVAIKIIRAIQKYRDASQIEIRVLKTLREHDPMNDNKCIHLLDTFSWKNHVCIVSELLGKSVFDFLKENHFKPFPPLHIWRFAKQLLQSVAFLHRLNLVHTDLKPENILLVNSDFDVHLSSRRANAKRKNVLQNTDIRLIDFGSATFNDEYHSAVVSTRHYRAPEIILQMGWSFPCDAWSIGCILVEFYTGDALFQTHDNLEHLAMMEAVLGVMPDDFRRKAETYKPDLFRGGHLNYPNQETPKNSRRYVRQMKKLSDIVPQSATHNKHNQRFLHLLRRLLEFDPNKRIKVAEALTHPYFDLQQREFPW
ncbi:uncharacterized protein PFL1_01453 [Pseudozyma flocculosa PF-1]|uniref:uncharacterized protein n=1 Tax=Pseudozyma flocculosa PF-1 TaxID=1277687 RepID=UPI000456125E|nr:uncharacterized protein PFL1_01453 [Pseudozyma flocculosa PF-1]EPQ31268.1 hypothetical protein PFL1_01453 [Pseudozyma flocculosa PF-1]